MPSPGIQIVKLRNIEALPTNGNPDDAYVNFENIHVGATTDFEGRRANFNSTFGEENVDFIPVIGMEVTGELMTAILGALSDYRITQSHRWLEGIDADQVIKTILACAEDSGISYEKLV